VLAERAISQLVDQLHRPFADSVTRAPASAYIITAKDASVPVEVQFA